MDPQEAKASPFHSAHNLMVGIGRVHVLMLEILILEMLMLEFV